MINTGQPLNVYARAFGQPVGFPNIDFAAIATGLRGERRDDNQGAGIFWLRPSEPLMILRWKV